MSVAPQSATSAIEALRLILGVATLFGSVVILDLRLLGFWPDTPLAAISRPTTRVAAARFGVAAVTGAGLLATKATEYVGHLEL
jgi:hypothetical protein